MTIDLLYDVLLQFSQVSPSGLIVLYASRDARYEDVVTVLDVLRSVGGDRVALATLPRDIDLSDPNATANPMPGLPQEIPTDGPIPGIDSPDLDVEGGLDMPGMPNSPSLPFNAPSEGLDPASQEPVLPPNGPISN